MSEKHRKRRKQKGVKDSKNATRVRLYDDELELINNLRSLHNEAIELGQNPNDVKHGWIKSKEGTLYATNPNYVEPEEASILDIDFTALFDGKIDKFKRTTSPNKQTNFLFDRLVYTDTHIGMENNPDGYNLYGGIWNEDEVMERADLMIDHVLEFKKSNTLVIDDLSDFMDGWEAMTTRGGHELPQNMSTQDAYDLGVRFKIYLVENLIDHYDKIICHNVCNSNHGGAFDYVVNSAFKTYCELRYDGDVEVHNYRRFLDHYQIGCQDFLV